MELARAFGKRLEALGPRYNALALPLTERAIRQAKAVDAEIKRGRLRGPLQGVPYGAKDLLSVSGPDHRMGRAAVRGAGLRLRRHGGREAAKRRRAAGGQAGHGGTGRRTGLPLRLGVG